MRFQSRRSSCGPSALQNALEAIGIKRGEDELISLCKQDVEGTDAKGLRKALATIEGTIGSEISESKPDLAMLRLLQALYEGRPVIVCVEDWSHWGVAAGILGFGQRIVCIDSGDNDLVVLRTLDEFTEWWCCKGAKKGLYGLVV